MARTGTKRTDKVYYTEIVYEGDDEHSLRPYGNKLNIYYNGTLLNSYYDHTEPEDNSFYRDYYWIAIELKTAFNLGLVEGRKQMAKALEDKLNGS